MTLKVLAVIIASGTYTVRYAEAPSRTYAMHEYQQKHGYNSISSSQVQVDQYHIVSEINSFYMYAEAFKLQKHLKKHSYDVVHFYFEYPRMIMHSKGYWEGMFSLAFATEYKSGLKPYLFTDSNYDIPLRQVANGVFYNIPSVGYSDYQDSLHHQ